MHLRYLCKHKTNFKFLFHTCLLKFFMMHFEMFTLTMCSLNQFEDFILDRSEGHRFLGRRLAQREINGKRII